MAVGPRLDLRQTQSLVMTPQLQQAIKLLALSNLELEAAIAEEIERNPLLEAAASEDAGDEWSAEPEADGGEMDAPILDPGPGDSDSALDVDFTEETFHHDSAADGGPGMDGGLGLSGFTGAGGGEDGPDFDSFAADAISLSDHLLTQIRAAADGAVLLVAEHIIGQLDEAGYLAVSLLDLANRLGVPLALAEEALALVQGLDPTGIGARSLAECIALQAKEADRYDPAMARLIDNLDLLAAGRIPQLKRMCGVDDEDMADMIRELRGYDPKPGLRFGGTATETVVPDIFVARRKSGWAVEINSATLPRLLVDRTYFAELCGDASDRQTKAWLSDCLASANWLVRALDQRQRTIVKVVSEIVKQQQEFFDFGVSRLRPLTLKQVADAIDMHESTVSRVTSNKYLSCNRGVFELKFFFTSAIASADGGEAASAEAVKEAIRTLIADEGADTILSDDTLVELLNAKGFEIARRTVAKYRESMGIGSSVQRRRQKAINARAA